MLLVHKIRCPGDGVAGDCELPEIGVGNEIQFSATTYVLLTAGPCIRVHIFLFDKILTFLIFGIFT